MRIGGIEPGRDGLEMPGQQSSDAFLLLVVVETQLFVGRTKYLRPPIPVPGPNQGSLQGRNSSHRSFQGSSLPLRLAGWREIDAAS